LDCTVNGSKSFARGKIEADFINNATGLGVLPRGRDEQFVVEADLFHAADMIQ
jgi:hypothetical protein